MGRHYKTRYKPPGYHAARIVMVPLLAAVLALGSCTGSTSTEDGSWKKLEGLTTPALSPVPSKPPASTTPAPRTTPATAPETPAADSGSAVPARATTTRRPSAPALPQVSSTSSPSDSPRTSSRAQFTDPSSTHSTNSPSSDQQEQLKISPRADAPTESIQGPLTPCQRSAAACFASGGLGELTDNLVVMKLDPVTGRFCFIFQPECSR